jgi:hypothetical protein
MAVRLALRTDERALSVLAGLVLSARGAARAAIVVVAREVDAGAVAVGLALRAIERALAVHTGLVDVAGGAARAAIAVVALEVDAGAVAIAQAVEAGHAEIGRVADDVIGQRGAGGSGEEERAKETAKHRAGRGHGVLLKSDLVCVL